MRSLGVYQKSSRELQKVLESSRVREREKMPGLLTMRPVGTASKATRSSRGLARPKPEKATWEEKGPAPPTTLVRVPSLTTSGFTSSQLQTNGPAGGARSKKDSVTENIKIKLLGTTGGAGQLDKSGNNEYSSSGSEHEPSSICLAAMVDEFMEHETTENSNNFGRSRGNDDDDDDSKSSLGGELSEILQGLVPCANATERILLSEVSKALAKEAGVSNFLRRQVMKHLRSAGYNAAICKSRWDHAGGFPGGDYEYIDVVFGGATGKSERIVIDVEFKAQFEIARPTARYNAVVQVLPTIFVGKADRLQQIVNVMSDAVKLSLKKRGMHLPPWRKPEYIRAKWFSSYRRTTNGVLHAKDDEDEDEVLIDIARIAVRGNGWDARFTDEMEVDYERAEARQAMKQMESNVMGNRVMKISSKRVEQNVAAYSAVENSDWQPPSLKARTFQRPGPAGLASILREAGLTASFKTSLTHHQEQALGGRSRGMAMAV